jgi:hypothetical protein
MMIRASVSSMILLTVAALASGDQPSTAAKVATSRFEFESFGPSRPLAKAERIVVAKAEAVTELPLGATVVRCTVVEPILPPSSAPPRKPESVVVLANRGEFVAATEYVLFLARFGDGGRYVALARIAAGDRDYEAKCRVLRQFAAVDRLEPETAREAKIRDLLVANLEDQSSFVRWNAIQELRALARHVKERPEAFGAESRATLVALTNAEKNSEIRDALVAILKDLGVDLRAN